jgi:glycogen debranching enzyme
MKSVFLTNKKGGYFFLSNPNVSQYQGLFFMPNNSFETYKLIEDIKLDVNFESILFEGSLVKRISGKTTESFCFNKTNEFSYEVSNYKGDINISLDFRFVHEFDDKGRIFKVEKINEGLKISYFKYLDDSLSSLDHTRDLFILGDFEFEYVENWKPRVYVYDMERKTKSDFYVNEGLKIKCNKNVKLIFKFEEEVNLVDKTISFKDDLSKAFFALDSLKYKGEFEGLFAGLPWFYQFWARDELISLKPYILKKDFDFVKSVIFRHLKRIDNGLVLNRYPESVLGSVDSLGILFSRIYDCLIIDKKVFSLKELKLIRESIVLALNNLKPRIIDNLLYNDELETWMDTSNENDFRKGFRVEIQALFLSVYKTLNLINKLLGFELDKQELVILKTVKAKLFKDYLRDGFNLRLSEKIRPNVFLAYYFYKDLLSKKEWEITFDKVISECFLDWGGFSSISKNHRLFRDSHSGITNESYHRGDSWFFVNNIAAICLFDLNKKKYKKFIDKIVNASLFEMNNLGALGFCAEISSAKELSSKGCFAQSWSAATLFELLMKTNIKES